MSASRAMKDTLRELRNWWAKRWGQCMRQKMGYSCRNRVCKGLEEH